MVFTDALAIEIKEECISEMVKEKYGGEYQRYLKKIKKIRDGDETRVLLLKEAGSAEGVSAGDVVRVMIPAFEPVTREQYDIANSVWPCYFYSRYEEKIDEKEVNSQADILIDKIFEYGIERIDCSCYCSGLCLIFDRHELIASSVDQEPIIRHGITNCVSKVSRSKRGYLCTGCTAFLYREPCMSCAMAFVHGRIKRVFVLKKTVDGSFSRHKLNYNRALNHRFNVYFYTMAGE